MNILLINHYAGSIHHGMEYRPFYLAREWVRSGHSVTIVAASHSHVRTHSPELSETIGREVIEGIQYLWLSTPPYLGNGVRRAVNIFAFVSRLFQYQKRILEDTQPDLVIASSTYPLDMLPARSLARRARARLVFEIHDLWPLSPIELGGMSPRHPFILLMQWAENYGYRYADRVVSMLPLAASHMQAHGMSPEKFVYIPNGIDMEEWEQGKATLPNEHEQVLQSLRQKGSLIVGYAGAHGVANALDIFLEAASLSQQQPIAYVLVGQGPEKARLHEQACAQGLTNIVFLPSVPKKAIPTLLDMMDVLYIGLQKQSLFRFGVSPNKLIDYMMTGKPVINAIEAGNDMVAESGCGVSIPAENPQALSNAVRCFSQMPETERLALGKAGRQYVLTHHDYRILARNFLDSIF